jgi:hypothetical protein
MGRLKILFGSLMSSPFLQQGPSQWPQDGQPALQEVYDVMSQQ